MNKKIIIIVTAIVVVLIGLSYFVMGMKTNTPTPKTGDQASTTVKVSTSEATSNKPGRSAPVVKTPSVQTSNTQTSVSVQTTAESSGLQRAFESQGSYRCVWTDKNTGADDVALIKDGKVRVESKATNGTQTNTIYTSIGTYIWKEGESTGTAIIRETSTSPQVGTFQSRSQLETQLLTDSRVTCQQSMLSDTHFSVPSNVKFQIIKA